MMTMSMYKEDLDSQTPAQHQQLTNTNTLIIKKRRRTRTRTVKSKEFTKSIVNYSGTV
jgi:hypothetical protein